MATITKQQAEHQAKVQLIQVGVRDYGNGCVYSAPSFTSNDRYIVTVVEGKVQSCQCRWYREGGFSQHICSHGQAVLAYRAEEARNAQEASQPVEASVIAEAIEMVRIADEKPVRRGYNTRPEIKMVNGVPMR